MPHRSSLHRTASGVALFTLLACVYLLAYRGHPLSIDEISLFDSVQSLSRHGTLARTTEFYRAPQIADDGTPFLTPLYEPLQILAAKPFYALAQADTGVGQFHAVALLNIVVTALTGVSLYVIGLQHGYSARTAWLGGLLFGTATLALPYSRWLFREPLMGLFALWAFAAAFALRQRMQRRQPLLGMTALMVASTMAMILTKQAGLLFVPGLILCLIPPPRFLRHVLPVLAVLVAVVVLFMIVVTLINPDFGDDRYDVLRWLNPANLGLTHSVESLLGYQVSPMRSVWLYSPLLLVGFVGITRLLRRETRWLVFGVVAAFLISSAAYGALRLGAYWNGGWNWGPRYMLPLVPLWMLFVLPVIETLWHASRWQKLLFIGVTAASIGMQVLGMALPYTDFYNRYYLDATAETAWLAENWSWQNTIIGYHLQHISLDTLDSAWRFADPVSVVPLALLTVAALTAAFARLLTRLPRGGLIAGSVILPVLMVACALLGLSALRHDSRYIGNRQDVYTLIQQLNAEARRGETVLLSGSEYMLQFMNWFKGGAYVITLPDDATTAIGAPTQNALDWTARNSAEVWLVRSPSAYDAAHPQVYRRALTAAAFPAGAIAISPFADAERFATGAGLTFETSDMQPVFGGVLRLGALSIPAGRTLTAGEVYPFALRWTPLAPLTDTYQLSIQVLDANGVLVAQRDTPPLNGASPTTAWQPDSAYDDRLGVPLPADLPAGRYTVNLIVYSLETLERLPVETDSGAASDALRIADLQLGE